MSVATSPAGGGAHPTATSPGEADVRVVGVLARVPGVAWIVAIALVARLLYGSGYVWYDALYHLVWGQDLAHGHLPPDLKAIHSPTPHPLPLLVSMLASLLGSHAYAVMEAISLLSLGGLCWAAFRLGQWLVSPAVGVLFALILFTRPFLISQTLLASIETPYLALIVWAAALEVRTPRRGTPVLIALGLAGLIRPEAWVLSGLYWLYLAWPLDWAARLKLLAAVVIAPLLWMAFDLAATGDALHSLHETKSAVDQPGTPRSLGSGLLAGPSYLRNILQLPFVLAGLVGIVVALRRDARRASAPLVIGLSGAATFLIFGLDGLPLLPRYAFQPAVVLALFAAVALLGWRELAPGGRERRAWMAAAGVSAALVIAFFPLSSFRSVRNNARIVHAEQGQMVELIGSAQFRAAYRACPILLDSSYFDSPAIAYLTQRHPRDISNVGFPDNARGLMFSFVRSPVPVAYGLPAVDPTVIHVPLGSQQLFRDRSWALYRRC
ncbi:MAG: hypothetical protein ACR2HD_09240 [Solirubrobacteraceae bacterium]|nr:MAG: hypothetical protein DLM63_05295 [Solirubrobacterales bacterium]